MLAIVEAAPELARPPVESSHAAGQAETFNGFTADVSHGLVVPVIRDADKKGLLELAVEAAALAAKAGDGKLSWADVSGDSFTISSLGGIGGTYFTPIINAPQVAILGVGKAQTRVMWDGLQPVPGLVLPLSMSWDHPLTTECHLSSLYLIDLLARLRVLQRMPSTIFRRRR